MRRAKSTDDHLFRLSQSIMESFNKGEHIVAAFLDVEKAFRRHKSLSSSEIFRNYFRLQTHFQKYFEEILDRCNTRYHRLRLVANKKWGSGQLRQGSAIL